MPTLTRITSPEIPDQDANPEVLAAQARLQVVDNSIATVARLYNELPPDGPDFPEAA